jgi:hypothetical protein
MRKTLTTTAALALALAMPATAGAHHHQPDAQHYMGLTPMSIAAALWNGKTQLCIGGSGGGRICFRISLANL